MKFLKAILSLLLLSALAVGAAACGNTPTETPSSSSETEQITTDNVVSEPEPILYAHPLTGILSEKNLTGTRPAAVMINNIKQALPQIGIRDADILVECIVEGGITRLMGIFSDYKSVGVIGSIRSSRPYYLDVAQMFDAIYCHHGGSNDAYSQIASRKIDNMDGITKNPMKVYYRDPERLKTMSLEHTMMITGEGIAKNVEALKYRTTLREGYEYPFTFAPIDTPVQVGTEDALHVYLPVSNYQKVDYVYNAETKEYLRYQHNGNKHIDGETNEQLSFKNVIVLFCNTRDIGDKLLQITTTGNGNGYLISEGKAVAITWSRTDREGNLTLVETATGKPIVINRGKTAINVCTSTTYGAVNFNAIDRIMQE